MILLDQNALFTSYRALPCHSHWSDHIHIRHVKDECLTRLDRSSSRCTQDRNCQHTNRKRIQDWRLCSRASNEYQVLSNVSKLKRTQKTPPFLFWRYVYSEAPDMELSTNEIYVFSILAVFDRVFGMRRANKSFSIVNTAEFTTFSLTLGGRSTTSWGLPQPWTISIVSNASIVWWLETKPL